MKPYRPRLADLLAACCRVCNDVSLSEVFNRYRRGAVSRVRELYCGVSHEYGYSWPEIGASMKHANHTTAIQAGHRLRDWPADLLADARKRLEVELYRIQRAATRAFDPDDVAFARAWCAAVDYVYMHTKERDFDESRDALRYVVAVVMNRRNGWLMSTTARIIGFNLHTAAREYDRLNDAAKARCAPLFAYPNERRAV